MARVQDRYPLRQQAPLDRVQSYIARRTGLAQPPIENRRRRRLERAPQVMTPATPSGADHDHTGVYAPVIHTHTSSSITDFTEAAQDAALAVISDSATIDWTYDDATNTASAAVIADSTVQKVDLRKNSTGTVFSRRRMNLIEGANVTLTVADDAPNNEVDITIAATGGGGGSADLAQILMLGGM